MSILNFKEVIGNLRENFKNLSKKAKENPIKYSFYLFLFVFFVTLDQVSKALVAKNIPEHDHITIIDKLLRFTYVKNRGVAFGFLQGFIPVFIVVAIIAIALIILILHKQGEEYSEYSRIGFVCILSGAVGNLLDRVLRGYVIDFFDFYKIFPYIFNVADVAVNIGVLLIILEYFFEKENNGFLRSNK